MWKCVAVFGVEIGLLLRFDSYIITYQMRYIAIKLCF